MTKLSILIEFDPSINFQFTQLDDNNQTQPVVRFVPKNFHMGDTDFHENRYKHHNIPTMVKKLQKVALGVVKSLLLNLQIGKIKDKS